MISLKDNIAPSFYPVHRAIESGKYTQFWLKGGRGSTKSSFTPIQIILGIIEDKNANALVLRKVSDTLRTSVHANFIWAIDILGLNDYFTIKTSPAEFIYRPTGQVILLKGVDKPAKLKSIKVKKGYFKYLWFEEVDEFAGMNEIRSIEQSVLRAGTKYYEFFTYNPPDDEHNWVNREVDNEWEGKYVHHSTYLDVPQEWLGQRFIKDAKRLKENDYEAYRHEYLGEVVGRTDKIIFNGKWIVDNFTPENWDGPYYGADWGFSNDPTVLVKLWINNDNLCVEYAHYGYHVDTVDTPELFDAVPGARKHVVRADSARPEMISHCQKNGYDKMTKAHKWTGSVEDGISYLRSFKKIIIHPRCLQLIEEAKNYSYKVNKAGDVTTDIVDAYNHGWDAIRYALQPLIKKRETDNIVIEASVTKGSFFDSEVVIY